MHRRDILCFTKLSIIFGEGKKVYTFVLVSFEKEKGILVKCINLFFSMQLGQETININMLARPCN